MKTHRHHLATVSAPVLALALLALSALSSPAAGLKLSDVEYGAASGESLKLDIDIPAGPGPFPAVIYVHGGGWTKGDKTIEGASMFDPLRNAGIARFSINYRLAPAYKYPASSDDVDTAIRWVKARTADYNIDPTRIVLMGDSAGGHLVALATTRADASTRVAATVVFYGPTDMEKFFLRDASKLPPGHKSPGEAYFGITADTPEARKLLREASPAAHVRAGLPPFLLLHGDKDPLVPIEQTVAFQQKLREAGVPCEFIIVKGGMHGMKKWDTLPSNYAAQVLAWLQKTLGHAAKK